MKKKFLSLIFLFSFYIALIGQDCYEAWLQSYENATAQYHADMSWCYNNAVYNLSMCTDEANISYDHALEEAGDAFINC
ncbi:MAG: hypothetical protein HKO66_01645 [Saprospiraceae bacterium]|nr:hypothetical protein [Saprospiraceae bacterium]